MKVIATLWAPSSKYNFKFFYINQILTCGDSKNLSDQGHCMVKISLVWSTFWIFYNAILKHVCLPAQCLVKVKSVSESLYLTHNLKITSWWVFFFNMNQWYILMCFNLISFWRSSKCCHFWVLIINQIKFKCQTMKC